MIDFKVNESRCTKCGTCVATCTPKCISMEKGELPRLSVEQNCKQCQHCLAVCPTAAITFMGSNPDDSMDLKNQFPPLHAMETLIKGRRSIRSYEKASVNKEQIKSLLETAWHAPTGTNAQGVYFNVTMSREVTEAFAADVYENLGRFFAEHPELENESLPMVYLRKTYAAYSEHGMDVMFRGAPHIIVASTGKDVPLPTEDCIIALTTFELLAQSNDLGTVWNGILTWCLTELQPEMTQKLGVPKDHKIGYCMGFGQPAVTFHRTVQRIPSKMNLVTSYQG